MNLSPAKLFRFIVPPLIAAVLVMAAVILILRPDPGGVQDFVIAVDDMKFLMGSGSDADEKLLINGYQNGMAAVSSGPVSIQSGNHYLLNVQIVTEQGAGSTVFFWRQKGSEQVVARLDLPDAGTRVIDLRSAPEWKGEIVEVGFLFQDPQGRAAELAGAVLKGDSLSSNVSSMWQAWFQFERWTLKSSNMLFGGAPGQSVYLPLVMLAWALLSILLFALINLRRHAGTAAFAVVVLLIAWMTLDVRWTINRAQQAWQSFENLFEKDEHEKLAGAFDGDLYKYAQRIRREVLNEGPRKILLIADESVSDYILLKTKYHLLPHAAAVKRELGDIINPENVDYVLFMSNSSYRRGPRSFEDINDRAWDQLPLSMRWRGRLKLVDAGEFELLFSVSEAKN